MSLNENKENTQSEAKSEKKKWKAWEKNLLAGAICFTVGLTAPIAVGMNAKSRTKSYQTKKIEELKEENRSLKKQLENREERIVTVPVYVTESIKATEKAAPVTDVPVTETQAPEKETTVPVTETETVKEMSEDEVRALTNPLTKEAAAPFQVKVSNVWKVYWINVERSDLEGLKPDDFRFFNDYINEHFEPDACDFYVVVTDIPDLCFQFTVTKSEYLRSTCEAFAGITKTDSSQHYPYCGTGSCAFRFSDADQFELQALRIDEYGLEQYDDDKIYHFSEFNDDMFAKLDELQQNAR